MAFKKAFIMPSCNMEPFFILGIVKKMQGLFYTNGNGCSELYETDNYQSSLI